MVIAARAVDREDFMGGLREIRAKSPAFGCQDQAFCALDEKLDGEGGFQAADGIRYG